MIPDLATAAQLACLLEASAPKPGNVSPGRHFADTRYEHFLASAAAIGPAFAQAGVRPLGVTIRAAVEATAQWSDANTNLGIVLLLAPLAKAASLAADPDALSRSDSAVRGALGVVLASTTVMDAVDVYAAIRLASPGGLGAAPDQDVANEPTATLLDVMTLAADRDGIAREYASGFATTFDVGVPALLRARADGLEWDLAIVECFLALLAHHADTHVARRGGAELAERVSTQAREVISRGGVRTGAGRAALDKMDRALRENGNVANPGTTADLTAAAIFVALLRGAWEERHAVTR